MNIKRAKQEIQDTIQAYLMKDEYGAYVISAIRQRPVLLIGPPGVGKTQIMEQISQECRIGLVSYTITHHTRQSAIGLPFIERRNYGGREYAVTEYTMSEIVASIYEKMEQTGLPEGILFIDEINCVSETLAPTMLQFLQGKSFGNHRIPQGWIIVAAGNPPEYNKSVREFDVVTLDRIRRIEVEPDYEAWKEYAVRQDIHPAIRSYLGVRRENFCRIETTVDGRLFATPRGWEDLSRLVEVYEKLGKTVDRELVAEYIQFPKIAKDFANYLELYYKYRDDYQVEAVLEGQVAEGVYDRLEKAPFDERIGVTGLLLAALNQSFRQALLMGEMLELRGTLLRQFHDAEGFPGSFGEMLAAWKADQDRLWDNGMVSRPERRQVLAVTERMEEDWQMLRLEGLAGDRHQTDSAEGGQNGGSHRAWERLREMFGADSDRYEDLVDQAGSRLEHAFDFMEAAFGGSQEMVLFVTELNTGFYSVRFLQEYECRRYYEYNRNLLFAGEEQEIRESLERALR
ncbi:MAG: AAA family ATPase [Lachnospiraceae bacterium]|nr:AAA family ATPase [Lachnospiraceae bacterium]